MKVYSFYKPPYKKIAMYAGKDKVGAPTLMVHFRNDVDVDIMDVLQVASFFVEVFNKEIYVLDYVVLLDRRAWNRYRSFNVDIPEDNNLEKVRHIKPIAFNEESLGMRWTLKYVRDL